MLLFLEFKSIKIDLISAFRPSLTVKQSATQTKAQVSNLLRKSEEA